MNRLARTWLIMLAASASMSVCVSPVAAQSSESNEGFFSRLFHSGSGETGASDKNEPTIDCPQIQVPSGESALRVGGEGSASVRHQFSVGDVARECTPAGNQVAIKVGVKGRVVLGPAGQPGSYSAPLRISVREQQGEKILVTKTYTVGASIPPGQSGANFTIVTDPFVIPFTTEHLADDYELVVGFGKDAKAASVDKRKRRRSKPSAAASQD